MATELRVVTSDAGISQNVEQTNLFIGEWETIPQDEYVEEVFHLKANGTDAQIMAAVLAWDILSQWVWEYWNEPHRFIYCWLYAHADGESAKRSVIRRMYITPRAYKKFTPLLGKVGMFYDLIIEREPWWESTTPDAYSASNVSCYGGHTLPAVTTGTVSNRIEQLSLTAPTDQTEGISYVWVGIQPKYRQTSLSGMNFRFIATEGTEIGAAYDNGAGAVQVNDPATTLTEYLRLSLSQHDAADYNKYRGKFLVLARIDFTGSGTLAVQMRYGCLDTTVLSFIDNPTVYIDSAASPQQEGAWVELGEAIFPFHSGLNTDNLSDDGISIKMADLTTGGTLSNVKIYDFVFIPATHMMKLTGCYIQYHASTPRKVILWEHPTGVEEALGYKSSDIKSPVQVETVNWYWPLDGNAVVIAANLNTGGVAIENMNIDLSIFKRWGTFRQ